MGLARTLAMRFRIVKITGPAGGRTVMSQVAPAIMLSLRKITITMRFLFVLLCIPFSLSSLYAQTKMIHGRVISEELEIVQGAIIYIEDTVEVGAVDKDGFFQIEVPAYQEKISIRYLAFEPAIIELSDNCHSIEVVMLLSSTYDYRLMLLYWTRINWIEKRRFNTIPKIHNQAFVKGIFETGQACYNRVFEPH